MKIIKIVIPTAAFIAGTATRMILKSQSANNDNLGKIDSTLSGWVGASIPAIASLAIKGPFVQPFAFGFSTPSLISLASKLTTKVSALPDANAVPGDQK